jgi:uncharacterized protein YecT (DUF1311 family)/prefoldin subunit 5
VVGIVHMNLTRYSNAASELLGGFSTLILLLAIALCFQSVPCEADVESETILIKAGEFLVDALKDYAVHDVIDHGVGFLTKRKEVSEVEKSLRESLDQSGQKTDAEISELRQEFRAAQIQLSAFQKLESPTNLTKTDADRLASQITASLANITATLQDHERRLHELERRMSALESKFSAERQPTSKSFPSQQQLRGPSFNCSKAMTKSERLICSNPILGDADGQLGEVYHDLLSLTNGAQTYELRGEERSWIKWRDQQLATSCAYNDQIDRNCALRIWQQRTQQLRERVRFMVARASGR